MASGSSAAPSSRRSWAISSSRRSSTLRCDMDNPIIFSICAFLMLMVILTWVGYRLVYKPGRFLKQLGNPVITSPVARTIADDGSEPEPSTVVTFLHQLGTRVPSSEAEVANLKVDLIRGGFRSD